MSVVYQLKVSFGPRSYMKAGEYATKEEAIESAKKKMDMMKSIKRVRVIAVETVFRMDRDD